MKHFNKINNEHKHDRLVPQIRVENKKVTAERKGTGNVSWNPKTTHFGSNVYIQGVPVDTKTQKPIPTDEQIVKVEVWADLQFEGISISSIALLREILFKIKIIYCKVRKLI